MNESFYGKVVVVSGGGRGIGEWLSFGFAQAGAKVVVASDQYSECENVADKIREYNEEVMACKMDVTELYDIHEALRQVVDNFGGVDILINNAGLVWKANALDVDEAFFDQMVNVNVKGAFFCAQIFGEQMIKQGNGKIINITSAAGKLIRKGLANPIYNMSKGAINMMTKALAEEWSIHNINVNAIGPGYFMTEPVKERLKNHQAYNSVIDSTPLSRLGKGRDIVGVAKFLASENANFMTGQILYVDGGRTIL